MFQGPREGGVSSYAEEVRKHWKRELEVRLRPSLLLHGSLTVHPALDTLRVYGLGSRVSGFRFRFLATRVSGFRFRVLARDHRVWGLRRRVEEALEERADEKVEVRLRLHQQQEHQLEPAVLRRDRI